MSSPVRMRGHVLTVLICTVAALGFLAFIMYKGGLVTEITGSGYRLHILMPTAASLTNGDRVTMAGIQVGEVTGVTRDNFDVDVSVALTDKAVYPLPSNSTVSIRQHTPIDENYISIARGSSPVMLPSGSVLSLNQTNQYVDVDQVLSMLQGQTRDRARQVLESLGGAVGARGQQLNTVVGQAGSAVDNIAELTNGVLSPDRVQIGDLVDSVGVLASAIGSRDSDIATIATKADTALTALGNRDKALGRTLDTLPGTLTSLRAFAGELTGVSKQATPVLNNLAVAATDVRPAVKDLPTASSEGQKVLASLSTASPKLQTLLGTATKAATPLAKVFPTVRSTLCQLNPILQYAQGREYPLLSIIIGLGSASASYDATSHLIRLFPVVGATSVSGLPASVEKAELTLEDSGLLGTSLAQSYNPYPAPSTLGTDHANPAEAQGPSEVQSKDGIIYPHVTAEC